MFICLQFEIASKFSLKTKEMFLQNVKTFLKKSNILHERN